MGCRNSPEIDNPSATRKLAAHSAISVPSLQQSGRRFLNERSTGAVQKPNMIFDDETLTRLFGNIYANQLVLLCGAGLSIPSPSDLMSAVSALSGS
jgi:hypothetical protein